MGLLDLFTGEDRGLLGLALMQAAQPRAGGSAGIGEGLLGAINMVQQRKAQQEDREMRKQQFGVQQQQLQLALDQAKRQAAEQQRLDAWRNSIPAPQGQPLPAAPYMGAARDSQAANVPQPTAVDPQQRFLFDAMRAGQINPLQYHQALQKDNTPIKLGAGERMYDRTTGKVLFDNPKEDATPSTVREYQFAQQQGYRGTFDEWKKSNAKAGATNVSVNTEKSLLTTVGETLGKQLDAGLASAKAAQGTISTAHSIRKALDSGKVISGPGASFRVAGLQLGQMLGVGGKDAQEILSNTRTVIQSMAQAELDAAQQMKGQGQITEAERDIIRRAASGNIDGLTSGEIRVLTDAMEKVARLKIAAHNRNLGSLKQMPNAAPLLPFYSVDEPPAYGAQTGAVRRYNPATGRIE